MNNLRLNTIVCYALCMSENVRRLNVALPNQHIERMQHLIADDPARYPSMSAFVAAAVDERLSEEQAHRMLLKVLRENGGEPTGDDHRWAQAALAISKQAAGEHDDRNQ